MSSSGDEDEGDSVVLSESEFESDFDHDSDLDPDSDVDSDFALAHNDPQAYSHTMCYPTCCLCRFEFIEGEEFVVYKPRSLLYPRIWYSQYNPRYKEDLVVEQGFHPCCVKILKPKTLVKNWSFNLSDVTSGRQHYLRPPVSWTKRRTRWYKESIASDLRQAINGRLPEEICQYIASFCMRERACLILRDLWLDLARPKDWIKKLNIGRNKSIWAQNMEVEGLRYVRSLSTRRLTKQDTLVYKARYKKRSARSRPEACLNIYYSEDHGGIREVIVTKDEEMPSLNIEPGLSWTVSRHQETPLQFVLRYDDIKLRFLRTSESQECDKRHEQRPWGVLPDRFDSFPQISLATRNHPWDRLHYESVRAVDWNSPGTCGPENQNRRKYDSTDDLWFHMPIDPDERISELWLRRGQHESYRELSEEFETLIVRTTKGRSFTPGLDSVSSFPADEGRKFCNKDNSQGVASWGNFEIEHSLSPSFNPFVTYYNFVGSSASLKDVRTITPCRGWSEQFLNEVVGLVFTYSDGRRRCVGQVRLDCLDPPLTVYSDSFWLGCMDMGSAVEDWTPWHNNVTYLCLSEPIQNQDIEYIKIPFSGRLEWAVLHMSSAVRHVEEGEPFDEIGQVMAGRKEVLDYASPEIKTFAVPIRVMETDF
ncbi:hypothetical protein FPCIR_714 [Fusarium pseudocircinatum]|uniref:Uncharacterized protein n=1 Tax=Fusarium pseudocircinatum TaxID=56676 RepID=A0A8H5UZD2_9HYPO|nr:hypothetical protein FPCIR_714 [Fusarium pseudocircinatum]